MKKNVQKLLSIVLTVIMMISMLPFSVFAADLDVYDVEEPAVEAVSVPAEEQEIESTVEDVLVGNAETEDELLVEDAEIVEDSSEEIETVDAADPAEADVVEESEEFAAAETVGAGADGTGFPESFTWNSKTYTKSGATVAQNANFRISGFGQTSWYNNHKLNGQVFATGTIYYQVYKSDSGNTVVVYEYPSTVEISRGSGLYISPACMNGGMITLGKWRTTGLQGMQDIDVEITPGYSSYVDGRRVRSDATTPLAAGKVTYAFNRGDPDAKSTQGTVDVLYEVHSSGASPEDIVKQTFTITYKDGVDDAEVFSDQVYKDEDAVEGNQTPHFKWPDKETGSNGDPVRPGYRFMGWTDQDGNSYANSDKVAAEKITGNATYTAQWAPNSITVSKEVALGSGVEMKDIDQTIYYALWDPKAEDWFKKDGQIVYKTITITDGVPSGNAVFDENDLLESLDYSVSELKVASGTAVTELSVNDEFEVDGKTIKVSGIKGQELDASGAVITDNDNNTHLDTTNAAYVKFINTYTSDQTDSFDLNKKWYDYQNGQRVDVTDTIQDVTATITLYRTIDGNTYEEVESKILNGTEPTPWKAEFTNLNHTDDNGNVYTYAARETACTAGYKAYSTNSSEKPMPATEYKSSHQNICNIQDAYGIYHSSNGTIEWFAVGKKIKLVDEVEPGYLYGGYYNYTETGNHKGSALDTYAKTGLDEDFTATENNTIYYLKEVPNDYLKTQAFVTYRKATPRVLRSMWFLTALDADGEYKGFGFIVNDNDMAANSGEELVIKDANGTPIERKTASSITKRDPNLEPTAVIVAADASTSYLTPETIGQRITVIAYYITPDNVKVTGTQGRTFSSVDRTRDNFVHGTKEKTYTVTAATAAASRTLSARKKLTINSAPEEASFTITKVDNGKKVAQTVKEGDNTGKITWAGKTNYVFAGWYEDASYSKAADFSNVKQDMTVYAKYVKASTVKLSFAKKAVKAGEVTLKATLKISNQPDIADTAVECTYKDNAYAVKFTGVKKSSATDTYTGTVKIGGLENNSTFTAVISYKTPDGTIVNMGSRTCKYKAGAVTVK